MTDIVAAGMAAAEANFIATSGRVPDNFRLLARHAPGTFAGYGVMRAALMKDRDQGGALDLKTKELIFALLDTLVNQPAGAKAHAANAMKLGLTLPELAEGLTQVLIVGGVTTWNLTGAQVMAHCEALAAQQAP